MLSNPNVNPKNRVAYKETWKCQIAKKFSRLYPEPHWGPSEQTHEGPSEKDPKPHALKLRNSQFEHNGNLEIPGSHPEYDDDYLDELHKKDD